jgi:hypothetical protein
MCNTCGCSAAEEINPVESVVVPAPLGRGVAQFYSEGGDMATYAPSEEAEGSTPATEPTNANFSAESKSMFGKDKNGRMYARRRNGRIITHNAESMGECFSCGKNAVSESLGHCLDCGQQYNAESMGECFSCGKNAVSESLGHCLDCGQQYNAESKSMFTKDKRGKMYARRRNGRIITRNAETRPISEDEELLAIYNDGGEHKGFIEMEDDLEEESIEIEISDDEMNEIADVTLDAEHEGLYACSKCKHWNRNPVDDITKCNKCGNGTFTFLKRSEFMPAGDGNVVGQQTFGFNGTPLHAEEDTSFGLVGEGNDFGQMRAEYEADYALEKPFTTGAKLSAGLLTGAALFGVVGASLTALLGSMMGRGE